MLDPVSAPYIVNYAIQLGGEDLVYKLANSAEELEHFVVSYQTVLIFAIHK